MTKLGKLLLAKRILAVKPILTNAERRELGRMENRVFRKMHGTNPPKGYMTKKLERKLRKDIQYSQCTRPL